MATDRAGPSGASNEAQANEEDDGPYRNIHGDNESSIESILGGDPATLDERLHALASQRQAAGVKVSDAAKECINIKAYAKESAAQAKERSAEFERKAREMSSRLKAEHCRRTADKLDVAAKLAVRRVENFETSLKFADSAVRLATMNPLEFVHELGYTEESLILRGKVMFLNYTRRNANYRTAFLKEDEYYVLKAMRRCWERYPSPWEEDSLQNVNANPSTSLPRDQTDNGHCKWISTILAIIVAIAGVLLIILCATLSTDKYSFGGMLIVGILSLLCSLVYAVVKIIKRCARKKQELVYDERRNFMLKFIDERLDVLSEYFVTYRITPLSDVEEEKDPNSLIIRRKRPELLNQYYD